MVLHRCQPCWRATHRCHGSSGCFDARPTPLHGPPGVLVQKQAKQVTDEIFRRLITASQTPARLRRPSGLARAFLNEHGVPRKVSLAHTRTCLFPPTNFTPLNSPTVQASSCKRTLARLTMVFHWKGKVTRKSHANAQIFCCWPLGQHKLKSSPGCKDTGSPCSLSHVHKAAAVECPTVAWQLFVSAEPAAGNAQCRDGQVLLLSQPWPPSHSSAHATRVDPES